MSDLIPRVILPGLPGGPSVNNPLGPTQKTISVQTSGNRLKSDERGVVISSPYSFPLVVDSRSGITEKKPLMAIKIDPEEIRQALLFWDKIHDPEGYYAGFHDQTEVALLVREDVVVTSEIHVTGFWELEDLAQKSRYELYRALDQDSPGQWAMNRITATQAIPKEDLGDGRGLLIDISCCLPVPNADTPLEELLEFTIKRRPEKLSLRHHLEGVYQKILQAPDRPLAELGELANLRRESEAYIRCLSENKISGKLASVSAEMEFNVTGAIAVTAASWASGAPIGASVVSGVVSSIAINLSRGLRKAPLTSTPFEYVSKYHSELAWIAQ